MLSAPRVVDRDPFAHVEGVGCRERETRQGDVANDPPDRAAQRIAADRGDDAHVALGRSPSERTPPWSGHAAEDHGEMAPSPRRDAGRSDANRSAVEPHELEL